MLFPKLLCAKANHKLQWPVNTHLLPLKKNQTTVILQYFTLAHSGGVSIHIFLFSFLPFSFSLCHLRTLSPPLQRRKWLFKFLAFLQIKKALSLRWQRLWLKGERRLTGGLRVFLHTCNSHQETAENSGEGEGISKIYGAFLQLVASPPPAQTPSRSPLHLHYIKQDEETQTDFSLESELSISCHPQDDHVKHIWRVQPGNHVETFPARSRANPHHCPHMACDWTPQVPPCPQLPAQSAARAAPANWTVSADGLTFFPPSRSRPMTKEREASNTGGLISENAL